MPKQINNIRVALENKTASEVKVLAQNLRIQKFSRKGKGKLIEELLQGDQTKLRKQLEITWWGQNKNSVFGWSSIIGVVIGIVFYAISPSLEREPTDIGLLIKRIIEQENTILKTRENFIKQ